MNLDITLGLRSGGTVRFVAEWNPEDIMLTECTFILDVLSAFHDHTTVALGMKSPNIADAKEMPRQEVRA